MHDIVVRTHANQAIATGLWLWFAGGCIAVLLVPELQTRNPNFGWLGYWFVLAPLIDLLVLYRRRWPLAVAAILVRPRRQRPRLQAARRRLRRQVVSRRRALLAALFNP